MIRLAIVSLLLAPACTFERGTGFATVESATIEGRLESDPLVAGEHRLTFTVLTLSIGHVVLEGERAQSEAEETAHCHGDECHAEGGDEHVAGTDEASRIVEAHFGVPLDVLGGAQLVAESFEPTAELPLATIERVRIELDGLRVEGVIEGGDLSAPVPIAIDVADPGDLLAGVGRAIDRDHGGAIALAVEIEVGPEPFEALDLAAPGNDELVGALLSSHVHVSLGGAEP